MGFAESGATDILGCAHAPFAGGLQLLDLEQGPIAADYQ